VFLCHASEDKAFTLALAERLNSDGIHAWIDTWDLLPGDRHVRKIFGEAIPSSDVVVIVMSRSSVNKPFPVEEWEAAWCERLERDLRLVVIRLDDVSMPVALKSTLRMDALDGVLAEEDYTRLRSAIFNKSMRPELGVRPTAFVAPVRAGKYGIEETSTLRFLLENVDGSPDGRPTGLRRPDAA